SRALQYARNVGTLVMTYSDDAGISGNGMVNEGVPATLSGIKSAPAFAEELMVARDIEICRYSQGRLHFGTLSTKGSMELVSKAKAEGLSITADVCAHQLFFDDTVITGYDTNFKVKPPFRSESDVHALRLAIANGSIDAICSDHSPHDDESKAVEFDFASYGIAGIETAFAAARTACKDVPLNRLVDCMSNGPRRVLGLEPIMIKEGAKACLTVFHPDLEWIPNAMDRSTMATNNPFLGMTLKGKVLGVVNNDQMAWFGN
ncbi:MAG: dihydroorotase, partial [Bacteroidota bacterium]